MSIWSNARRAIAQRLTPRQRYWVKSAIKTLRHTPKDAQFRYQNRALLATSPLPPVTLRYRVSGMDDIAAFNQNGLDSRRDFDKALQTAGGSMANCRAILDFGVGCGRIMRWMKEFSPPAELYGTDIDAPAIHWSQKNLKFAQFSVNDPLPPLKYPDEKFDLIYASSVFTHLDEEYQDAWLAELKRVSQPGAILLLTVHGSQVFNGYASQAPASPALKELRRLYETQGFVFLSDDPSWTGIFPAFYRTMFHQKSYILEHWAQYFKIVNYLELGMLNFQDIVVLQKG